MAFRADEEAARCTAEATNYLIPRAKDAGADVITHSRKVLAEIIQEIGPAIDGYPTWHPLVSNQDNTDVMTYPQRDCGYKGLDHTRYFVNGFITCPYGDGRDVFDSVDELPVHPAATITAERIDAVFYNPNATPILVKCEWDENRERSGAAQDLGKEIPLPIAIALLIRQELPCWEHAQVAETWEAMRPYFLGSPHGARSSLFVGQETGQTMKKVWNTLINTGMFGPIRKD